MSESTRRRARSVPSQDRSSAWPTVRPWELPGNFRLDGDPHRGEFLQTLAEVGLVSGQLALCLAPLAILGLVLGVVAWVLARRDLGRMRRGLMDPAGERLTRGARRVGASGALTSALVLLYWAAFALAGHRGW